jgi:hypothetical protein
MQLTTMPQDDVHELCEDGAPACKRRVRMNRVEILLILSMVIYSANVQIGHAELKIYFCLCAVGNNDIVVVS